ncbi:MAG: hypothetical protein QF634_16725 [Vicinamibacterales bacterium]|jgi:hypothetical protein|nr:hypothetical protein [Vicinamibacterales bacterium]|tara:strand:- start:1935 stop:2375 length:441 start_codon:yes stop_codon:yes gene_type:complete
MIYRPPILTSESEESTIASDAVRSIRTADRVFGESLKRYHVASYVVAGLLLACLIGMAAVGDGADRFAARGALITTMLIVSLYSGMGVSPRIERMQREIGGSVAALPVDDARRGQFGRLHALSTALLVADGVGALVLMYWEARRGM